MIAKPTLSVIWVDTRVFVDIYRVRRLGIVIFLHIGDHAPGISLAVQKAEKGILKPARSKFDVISVIKRVSDPAGLPIPCPIAACQELPHSRFIDLLITVTPLKSNKYDIDIQLLVYLAKRSGFKGREVEARGSFGILWIISCQGFHSRQKTRDAKNCENKCSEFVIMFHDSSPIGPSSPVPAVLTGINTNIVEIPTVTIRFLLDRFISGYLLRTPNIVLAT